MKEFPKKDSTIRKLGTELKKNAVIPKFPAAKNVSSFKI
jgi:hypothetical protein